MVATRSSEPPTDEKTFLYIIEEILAEKKEDSPIRKAFEFEGIQTIYDLLSLDEESILNFRYLSQPLPGPNESLLSTDADDIQVPLNLGNRRKLILFLRYHDKLPASTSDISNEDWLAISKDDFNKFRLSSEAQIPIPDAVALRSSKKTDLATDFRKTVKRDKTQYLPLKDDQHWDSWNRSFIATAKVHGLHNIIDHNYAPQTADDRALFSAQQEFMFSVLNDILLTYTGKIQVREHAHTSDA